jgi:hypothetical protein
MFERWRAHFESNRTRPLPRVSAPSLLEAQRAALASSLARFQLGETGEGRIAAQIDQVQLPHVDADYRACLKLFIAEEGRHARVLALMVKALGGRLLERSWTHRLFVVARRLVGVRFKLLVMLVAEVIAIAFYGLLARALPSGEMAAALEQIRADERAHFDFHCDFFRGQPRGFRWVWWPLAILSTLTVLVDHAATLRAFGVPLGVAWNELWSSVELAARQMRPPGLPARSSSSFQKATHLSPP